MYHTGVAAMIGLQVPVTYNMYVYVGDIYRMCAFLAEFSNYYYQQPHNKIKSVV